MTYSISTRTERGALTDTKESVRTMDNIQDRLTAESHARCQIEQRLGPLVTLADKTDSLFERAINAHVENARPTAAAKVCLILTARLANDLRVCSIVGRLGYGLQAFGLAATVVELVGALSYIGDSDERACAWAEHTDQRKTYPPGVSDGIDAALAALGVTDPAGRDLWRRAFGGMCMAKHANPMLSMQQGLRILPDGAYFVSGPDASQLGVNMSALALYHAVGFGTAAIYVIAQFCSDERLQTQLRNDALRIKDQLCIVEPSLVQLIKAEW